MILSFSMCSLSSPLPFHLSLLSCLCSFPLSIFSSYLSLSILFISSVGLCKLSPSFFEVAPFRTDDSLPGKFRLRRRYCICFQSALCTRNDTCGAACGYLG